MSSKTASREDPGLPLRLKHGIHTIFMFADPQGSVSDLTTELLTLLRERFPDGLKRSVDLPERTPIPAADDDSIRVVYAKMRMPKDPKAGWIDLKFKDDETIGLRGLKDHQPVAFAFVSEGEAPEWVVDFPTLTDEE